MEESRFRLDIRKRFFTIRWGNRTGCPKKLWVLQPSKCSKSGWVGPWATQASRRHWNYTIFKILSNTIHSIILGLNDSMIRCIKRLPSALLIHCTLKGYCWRTWYNWALNTEVVGPRGSIIQTPLLVPPLAQHTKPLVSTCGLDIPRALRNKLSTICHTKFCSGPQTEKQNEVD